MILRPWGTGYQIGLKEATQREGSEARKFYFEPVVLENLIRGSKFNQGAVEWHPKYGLSIILGYRKEREEGKHAKENKHEP